MHPVTSEVINFITEVQKENGSNYKKSVVSKYLPSPVIQEFLQQLLDKRISYGVQQKRYASAPEQHGETFVGKGIVEVMKYLSTNNTGRQELVSELKGYINSHPDHVREQLELIVQRDINLGISAKTVNSVYGGSLIYELTLMKSTAFNKVVEDYRDEDVTATIKLDGIRLTVVNDKTNGPELLLRSGHLAEGLDHIAELYQGVPEGMYDGELVIKDRAGKDSRQIRQETSSIVRNADSDKTQLEHIIFDGVSLSEYESRESVVPYTERRERLAQNLLGVDGLRLVDIVYQGSNFVSEWESLLDKYVSQGEEGLMVIKNKAPYVFKLTKDMAKIKKSYPMDLRVVSIYEGKKASTKGVMGGAVVHYKQNEVYVGGGWSKEQREYYWEHPEELIGKIIEIRHDGETQNKSTGKYSLSYPRFMYVRDDKDEESIN